MIQPFTELAQRYRGREDSEHEQAFVRLAIIVVFLAYLLGATAFDRATGDRAALVLYVLLAETAVAIGLLVWIAWRPKPSHARRWIGMLADYAACGIGIGTHATSLRMRRCRSTASVNPAPSRSAPSVIQQEYHAGHSLSNP